MHLRASKFNPDIKVQYNLKSLIYKDMKSSFSTYCTEMWLPNNMGSCMYYRIYPKDVIPESPLYRYCHLFTRITPDSR